MSIGTSIKKTQVEGRSELVYFTNFIFRNVISVRTIGNVHDGRGGIRDWVSRNGFEPIFDLSSEQLLKSDLTFLSELTPDAIIAYNPFRGHGVKEIEVTLGVLDRARHAIIAAVPSGEKHLVIPKVVYRINQWKQVFSQLGSVVEVFHCEHYSLFLVIK